MNTLKTWLLLSVALLLTTVDLFGQPTSGTSYPIVERATYSSAAPCGVCSPWQYVQADSTLRRYIGTSWVTFDLSGSGGTADGSETKINAGINVTTSGTGTIGDPYIINSTGGGGATNLSNTPAVSSVAIESSTGTNTTIPSATLTEAGVMTAADRIKLTLLKQFVEIDNGKSKLYAVPGTVLDNTTQGVFKYTAAEFGGIKTLILAIERTSDSKGNGDLDIIFDYVDNQVNTWQPGDNLTDFDLYAPSVEVYDWSASLLSVSSMAEVEISPEITYANGEVQLRYLDASTYGSISRLLFVFTF